MKKIVVFSLIGSASLASAFLGFGSKDTSTTGQTQTTSSSGGSFFDRFRKPSAAASPGAPTSQQPSFFDRFRRSSSPGTELGGIAGRAGLRPGGEERIAAQQALNISRQQDVMKRAQEEAFNKRKIDPSLLKKYLPHLQRKSGNSFYWYEIFDVRPGIARTNPRELRSQYDILRSTISRRALDPASREVAAAKVVLDSLFDSIKRVYNIR